MAQRGTVAQPQNPWVILGQRAKPVSPQGATFETLLGLEERLGRSAFLTLTPWWAAELERFYRSSCKRFAGRVGRGGVKSTTMVDVAINETLNGDWTIPKGENHWFAFISQNKSEAQQRLVQIEMRLIGLGVQCERSGDQILVPALQRGFRVFACTIGAVSGFRCFGFVADELSKWRTADRSANPAAEVIASVRAMTITHPKAREFLVSSPWGVNDLHYQVIQRGTNDEQIVAEAPTWVANPSVTEEETHTLESDPATWSREYAAIPSQGLADNWYGSALDLAVTDEPAPQHYATRYHICIDPAFTRDRFGYAVIASHKGPAGKRVTWVHACDSWDPKGMRPSELARRVKTELCDHYGQPRVYSDQYEGSSFGEICRQEGIHLEVYDWTNAKGPKGKTGRHKSVRNAMLEGGFKIPRNPDLLKELREVYGVYNDGGTEIVNSPRTETGHGDRVSAMVLGGSIALEYAAQDVVEEPVKPGTPEYDALEQKRMRDKMIAEARKRQRANKVGGIL